jgi:hypothetical protein
VDQGFFTREGCKIPTKGNACFKGGWHFTSFVEEVISQYFAVLRLFLQDFCLKKA